MHLQHRHQQTEKTPQRLEVQLEQVSVLRSGQKAHRLFTRPLVHFTLSFVWGSSACFGIYAYLHILKTTLFCASLKIKKQQFHWLWFYLWRCSKTCDEKELEVITDIKSQIKEKASVFFDMEAYLPKRNGSVLLLVDNAFTIKDTEYNFFSLFLFSGSTWTWSSATWTSHSSATRQSVSNIQP